MWRDATIAGRNREGTGPVTENERRATDTLQVGDVVLRGAFALALILVAFAALMAVQTV